MKTSVDDLRRDLQTFLSNDELGMLTVDADEGNGELCINVPESFKEIIKS
jgi:hypothetical protein